MAFSLIDGLNEQQRAAVTFGEGPVLVLAGPGSGKTRVLTHRVAYLIREMNVHPSAIVAVTFTNRAAGEMRQRVESLVGARMADSTSIGTFHSLCARMLRHEARHTPYNNDFAIYDTDDQLAVIKQAMAEQALDEKRYNAYSLLNAISNAKNELITPERYRGIDYFTEIAGRIYVRYQEILIENNAMDFDDLLMQMALLLEFNDVVRDRYQRFYEHLLVDEFQDTNVAQYHLIKLMGAPQQNIFVVGDEDQGIYAFRGADYRNVLLFRKDFPSAKVILLEQNYRSTQIILDVARAVIDRNTFRTPKKLFTTRQGGVKVRIYEAYDEKDEGSYVVNTIDQLCREQGLNYNDFAVMYRTNAQSRALEQAFRETGTPYRVVGSVSFFKRQEVRHLLSYLRLTNNPNDSVSFNRVINMPPRGIGDVALGTFQQWAVGNNLPVGDALLQIAQGVKSPLGPKARLGFAEFGTMLMSWQRLAEAGDLVVLFDEIMAATQYNVYLNKKAKTDEEKAERADNIRELRSLITEHRARSLPEFLNETALVTDIDTFDETSDAVTLLTLHAAKGLEFPVVFITGVEDGLLPHFRSRDDPSEMEEERRLAYVGLTRAKDRVYLTYAFRRISQGSHSPTSRSAFLDDVIATGLTEGVAGKYHYDAFERRSYQRETTWDWTGENSPRKSKDSAKILSFEAAVPPPLKFPIGKRVRHVKFGEGVIIENKRTTDNDEEVTIAFEGIGIKKLMASYGGMTIISR